VAAAMLSPIFRLQVYRPTCWCNSIIQWGHTRL